MAAGELCWVPLADGIVRPASVSILLQRGRVLPIYLSSFIDMLKEEFARWTHKGRCRGDIALRRTGGGADHRGPDTQSTAPIGGIAIGRDEQRHVIMAARPARDAEIDRHPSIKGGSASATPAVRK